MEGIARRYRRRDPRVTNRCRSIHGRARKQRRRGILLPATMKLLGDPDEHLFRWLEWLPTLGARRVARAGTGGDARYAL